MVNARSQYAYFESLERTIKIALAVYFFLFLSGALLLVVSGSRPLEALLVASPATSAVAGALFLGLYALAYTRIDKIHWLGELHIWLDRKFFGFLFRSNDIIFHTLLFSLPPAERDAAYELDGPERERVAETIFSKLANDSHLFPSLLRSGIFRLWVWYWVTNYGTAIFSALTIVSFPVFVLSSEALAKSAFGVFWTLALAHLFTGLLLGNRLLRMTKEVSEDIVKSYGGEIAALLRDQLDPRDA